MRMYWTVLVAGLAACGEPEDTGQTEAPPLAKCEYRNVFTSEPECKDYTGSAWTLDSAAADCETAIVGGAGTFVEGESCALTPMLGTCVVESDENLEYVFQIGGDDADGCSGAELACTSFAAGAFEPTGVCTSGEGEDDHTVFIWPYETCEEPLEGEEDGDGPDGSVCVWNLISGCTEEGRDYRDYGSCDVVFTNRPYYPVDAYDHAEDDDPRLSDEDYMAELEWVTEQTAACACVCCHSDAAPDGASIWGIDGDVLWPDQMSDTAIGMFAGYVDSSALGAFPADENNGFDRENSAMPTTDPERMVAFWRNELNRRGLDESDMADEPPVGQTLLEQIEYSLPDCEGGDGMDADGNLIWESDFVARYVYVLEEGSENPGLPPNFDMPEGILWRVDIPYDGQPMTSGVPYGQLPTTAMQQVPEGGEAPELVPGQRYHLYVLYDVALPVARCVFEAPEVRSGGCSTTGAQITPRLWLGVLMVGWLLGMRRR